MGIFYKKISASERLPEKEGYYFVWWKNSKENEVADCLLFKKGKFFSYEDDEIVTDWLEETRQNHSENTN